jgi:hypothetical protein
MAESSSIAFGKMILKKETGEENMNKSGEEILADIDHTLDQLIRNAHMLKQISEKEAFASYSARMHKSQTSLAARIIHMEELLDSDDISEEKAPIFEAIQRKMLNFLSKKFNKPRIGRNRKKSN